MSENNTNITLLRINLNGGSPSELYTDIRGREDFEIFRSCDLNSIGNAGVTQEIGSLFSKENSELLDIASERAHPRTYQIKWPKTLLSIKSNLSKIDDSKFSGESKKSPKFKKVSAGATLDSKFVVAIDSNYSLISRSYLDSLLMVAAGNILEASKKTLNTRLGAEILRKKFRVVYYNSSNDSSDVKLNEQIDRLGHYFDTALLRISDRYSRALRREDDVFLYQFTKPAKEQAEQVASH